MGRPSIPVLVLVALILAPLTVCDSGECSVYESPDGTYGYAVHGSGSESSPYWSEILSFSFSGDVVFLQSSLEGFPVTKITSLSGCSADTVVFPRTVDHVADDALGGSSVKTLVFLGDKPSSMPRTDAEIVALGGTGGWDEAQSTLPISEYRGEGTSFSYYTLNGESYVYGALDDGTVDVPDTDCDGNPFVGIDSEAFRDGDVSALILGPNVRFVGTRAFYGCESLTSAELGGGVGDIRDEAFRYCVSLGNVDLSGVRTIGFESFRDCRSFTSISIPDSVVVLGGGAFYLCRSTVRIELGSGFDAIPERAFGYCGALESIDLSGKTEIGDSAFIYCKSLTSLKLDPGTLSIGDSAFSWCLYLEDADLGESLRSVGSQAFSECRSLKSVAFPESLSSAGGRLFFHCNSLTDLYFNGEMPAITGDLLFGTSDVSIHIYSDCAESWGEYSDHLVIEERPSDVEGDSDAGIFIAAGAIIAIAAFAAVLVLKRR